MVDNPPDKLEWADPHCQRTECLDGDGRLIDWMGCSMRRSEDRRSLVEAGAETPHKLPGVVSCLPGLQMLLQEQEKHTCPLKMDNTSAVAYINKMGGTVSSALNNINKEFWLWCMERDISVQAQHFGRKTELDGRRGVKGSEGQIRLDALPESLPEDQSPIGTAGGGSTCICLKAVNPTANLRELETGPGSNGRRCLHNFVDRSESICQPTMEPCRQGSSPSSTTESGSGPNSTGVEITTMVPSATGNVHRTTQIAPSIGQPDPTNTPPSQYQI